MNLDYTMITEVIRSLYSLPLAPWIQTIEVESWWTHGACGVFVRGWTAVGSYAGLKAIREA